MYTPQQTAEILLLRQKVNNGTISQEELKQGLALLRTAREGAHAASAVSRTRKNASGASKQPVNSDALLNDLDNL